MVTTYIEDTVVEGKITVLIYIILIILFTFVFFSKYLFSDENSRIEISETQFDLVTNRSQLPEGFQSEGVEEIVVNGETVLDPRNFSLEDLDTLSGLLECPENECAIDLNTGVKRCPQNSNTRIVYNQAYEACTSKFFCTSDQLPYAILSSGETDNFGVCEKDVVCRCTDSIVCPKYVVSKINLRNGNNYSSKNDQLSYYFDQTTLDENDVTGYDSITIDSSNQASEFCRINPSYIDRMSGGCDFVNSDRDILGCFSSQDYYELDEFEQKIGPDFTFSFQDNPSNSFNALQFQGSLNIKESGKPQKGFASFTDTDGNIQLLSYGQNQTNIQTFNFENSSTVSDLLSVTLNPNTDTAGVNLGVLQSVNGEPSDFDSLKFMNVIFTGCASADGQDVSNKNMLVCLQKDNQPCKEGFFTYRIDDKDPRDFCRYNPTLLEYISKNGDFSKLSSMTNDPQKYTVSCVTGGGCNGDYVKSFCKNGSCDDAIQKYKDLFLGDYDTSATNSTWVLKSSNLPLSGEITFTYTTSTGLLLKNDGLLQLEKGDFFSVVRSKIQKLTIEDTDVSGTTAVFSFSSVDELQVGFFVYYSGYRATIQSIDTVQKRVTVNNPINQNNITLIPKYSLVDNFKPVDQDKDGVQFGRLYIEKDGKIYPGKTNIVSQVNWDNIPDIVYVYKQFGFNGLGYNTNIAVEYDSTTGEYSYYRVYNNYSQWYYWLKDFDTTEKNLLQPPLNSIVVPLAIKAGTGNFSRNSVNTVVFSSPESDYKRDLSFYHPVWDDSINRQICSRCKPSLYTYSKIREGKLSSVVIQFSGKDFGQYQYIPKLTSVQNYFTLSQKSYSFGFFNYMSTEDTSTSRRIVLEKIDPNLPFSSDVPVGYYTDNPYFVLDGHNVIRRSVQLVTVDPIHIPSQINLSLIPISQDYLDVVIPEDKDTDFVFDGKRLTPDSTLTFGLSNTGNTYTNFSRKDNSNIFSGKQYYSSQVQYIVESQVKVVKVELIGGKQVVTTDSMVNNVFTSVPTVLQFVSQSDTLDITYTGEQTGNGESIIVDGISDSRITSLNILNPGTSTFDIGGLPIISFSKYRIMS
jgi:hypothetical protein